MKGHTLVEVVFWLALAACWWLFPLKLPLLTQILIMGLFAMSLDLALGHAGILTVGHAAFFGTGAYVAGLLAVHGWGEPLTGLLAAASVCLVFGYLMAFLVVRGSDLTRLMLTIAVCLLLVEAALQFSAMTGGSDGLWGIQMWPVLGLFGFDLAGRTAFAYSFIVVLCLFLLLRRVVQSPFGLALRGSRQNPKRMDALGAPVAARLRTAYAMSAGVAGVAGALLTQTTQFVGVQTLTVQRSAEVLIVLVLGGAGHLYGGLVGALLYWVAHDWFSGLSPQYWMLAVGTLLIVVALFGGGGVLGVLRRMRAAVKARGMEHKP